MCASLPVWQLAEHTPLLAQLCQPMATSTLSTLPPNTALWRIEKLPLAEIRERLTAADLQSNGTKRTVARRLLDHLRSQEASESEATGSEVSDQQHTNEIPDQSTDGTAATSRCRGRTRHGRRSSQAHSPLSSRDVRAVRQLLRRRPRGRTPSPSTTSSSSPRSLSSDTASSVSTSARRRRRHRSSRSRTRSRSRHGRSSHRRRGRHSATRRPRRQTGNLPPIPDKLKGRIKRGEFVNLTKASGRKRDRYAADTRDARRAAAIADFESWMEAWSVYAAPPSFRTSRLAFFHTSILLHSKADRSRLGPGCGMTRNSA